MDLSKLTPAPWAVGSAPYFEVFDAEGLPIGEKGFKDDMEFIALARNAFAGGPEALAWWEANRVKKEATNG